MTNSKVIDLNKSLMANQYPQTNFISYDLFDGQMYHNRTQDYQNYVEEVTNADDLVFFKSDVVGVALDLNQGTIQIYKNGQPLHAQETKFYIPQEEMTALRFFEAKMLPFVQIYKSKLSIFQPEFDVKKHNEISFQPLSR